MLRGFGESSSKAVESVSEGSVYPTYRQQKAAPKGRLIEDERLLTLDVILGPAPRIHRVSGFGLLASRAGMTKEALCTFALNPKPQKRPYSGRIRTAPLSALDAKAA